MDSFTLFMFYDPIQYTMSICFTVFYIPFFFLPSSFTLLSTAFATCYYVFCFYGLKCAPFTSAVSIVFFHSSIVYVWVCACKNLVCLRACGKRMRKIANMFDMPVCLCECKLCEWSWWRNAISLATN